MVWDKKVLVTQTRHPNGSSLTPSEIVRTLETAINVHSDYEVAGVFWMPNTTNQGTEPIIYTIIQKNTSPVPVAPSAPTAAPADYDISISGQKIGELKHK